MAEITPQTLKDSFVLFAESHPTNHVANLRTVFRRHLLPFLPGYGFTPESTTGKQILSCFAKVPLKEFTRLNCQPVLEKQLQLQTAEGKITQRTADNYLSDYDSFIHWLELQKWYQTACGQWDERYAPRLTTKKIGSLNKSRRGKGKDSRNSPYRLREEQISPELAEQFKEYKQFWTNPVVEERQDEKLTLRTFSKHRMNALYFLGWLINIEGKRIKEKEAAGRKLTPDEEKNLRLSANLNLELFEDIKLLKKCVAWGINERKNGHGWAETLVKASLSVAKFLNADGAPNQYRGVESIDQIRIYLNQLVPRARADADAADTTDKEMTHEQCRAVVERLRRSCAPRRQRERKRSLRAILLSWQRYLIIGILTYCPLRGRELQELRLNGTLFKERNSYWLSLRPEDNKTKKVRKVNLSKWLPTSLIADLDEWLTVWRPKVKNAMRDFDQWLGFWDYTQSDLNALTDRLEQIRGVRSEAYVKQTEAKIRGLKNLIDIWQRSDFQADHDYVFFALGSPKHPETIFRPYCDEDPDLTREYVTHFGRFVKTAVFRTTGLLIEEEHPLFEGLNPKSTHPHFFRHIDSTELRRQEVSHKVLKAFHEGIGNSVAEGDRSYNLLSPEEKTAAAAGWWNPKAPQTDEEKMAIIKKLLFELPPEQRRIIRGWI